MRRVYLTGSRGFLRGYLAAALESRGHRVVPLEEAEIAVDLTHDMRPGTLQSNIDQARQRFESVSGLRRIYISSHSARADAVSEYGVSKYRIERFYLGAGETVVRPGLVIGPGGLFLRHIEAIQRARIIPLIDGGRDSVAVLALADFCLGVVALVESERSGEFNLFNSVSPTMREIVECVLRLYGRRTPVIGIPFGVAQFGVSLAERLGLPLPFSSESLRTMVLNRTAAHRWNLSDLVACETHFEAAIAAALGRRLGE